MFSSVHAVAQAAATRPASCSTGSWQQKWNCGWHQPTTTAANAGYATGHDVVLPVLGVLVVVLILLALAKARSRTPVTSR